jgi:hypothetical protein
LEELVVGKMGEGGKRVDPVAKQEIRGPKQQNLTRSNKCKKKLGWLFLWGFSKLGQNKAKSG